MLVNADGLGHTENWQVHGHLVYWEDYEKLMEEQKKGKFSDDTTEFYDLRRILLQDEQDS